MIQKHTSLQRTQHVTIFARAFSAKLVGSMDFVVLQLNANDLYVLKCRMQQTELLAVVDSVECIQYRAPEATFVSQLQLRQALRNAGVIDAADPLRYLIDEAQVAEHPVVVLGDAAQLLEQQVYDVINPVCEVHQRHVIYRAEFENGQMATYEITEADIDAARRLMLEEAV